MIWVSVFLAAAFVIALALWLVFRSRVPRLSSAKRAVIRRQWEAAVSRADPHRKVIEADAVVAKLLRALGYPGSMADGLKKAAAYVPHLDHVWSAHKLRNRLAHEPGMQPTSRDVDEAMKAFGHVIDKFCN